MRLRANNAGTRLTPLGLALGCIGAERTAWFARREQARTQYSQDLEATVSGHDLAAAGLSVRAEAGRLALREWLRFGGIGLDQLAPWLKPGLRDDPDLAEELAEDAAYAPYLARQDNELRDLRAGEGLMLGDDFPYPEIAGLSREMVERLNAVRPATLAAAGRVPGITPAALAALLVHARRRAA